MIPCFLFCEPNNRTENRHFVEIVHVMYRLTASHLILMSGSRSLDVSKSCVPEPSVDPGFECPAPASMNRRRLAKHQCSTVAGTQNFQKVILGREACHGSANQKGSEIVPQYWRLPHHIAPSFGDWNSLDAPGIINRKTI